MKYTSMQKQLIADYTLRRRELREDEIYLETEVTQSKVDKIRLKLALNKEQDNCEAINFANATAAETLSHLHETSTIGGTLGELGPDASYLQTARMSNHQRSIDNTIKKVSHNQWNS